MQIFFGTIPNIHDEQKIFIVAEKYNYFCCHEIVEPCNVTINSKDDLQASSPEKLKEMMIFRPIHKLLFFYDKNAKYLPSNVQDIYSPLSC